MGRKWFYLTKWSRILENVKTEEYFTHLLTKFHASIGVGTCIWKLIKGTCAKIQIFVVFQYFSYQALDHGWSLYSEVLDGLENVSQPLNDQPLQHYV